MVQPEQNFLAMKTIKIPNKIDKVQIEILLSIIFPILFSAGLTAQKSNMKTTRTGTVVDVAYYPVVNAIVLVDGHNSNSFTQSDGKYKVRVKRDAEKIGILTSENGFIEVPINTMTRINFQFKTNVSPPRDELSGNTGDEVINIGYSSIKKKHLTTQTTEIDGPDRKLVPYSNIYEMIQREVAGVRVNGTDIIIHGSDFYLNPIPPLLVVDGVYVNSLSAIPPSVVESIVVLKSAAAAIYGTRGYGGAILITTKVQ
jgi:TonB-dependent SusC/RagA subfamily outer membrane receptor